LSLDAAVKPLVADPVKEIRLDTTHKVIEIAPGVKFSAWTFGDQVPGPIIRARVGDRVKFSMTNRSDEVVPGMQVAAAPMMHSMDFHSAMVSPQDKYHFANASQGAIGLIAASDKPAGEPGEASDSEHHNIPATAAPNDPVAVKGKLAFESKCFACHSIAGGDKLGPDLFGVTKRRDQVWLTNWLKSPEKMLQSDAAAKEMLTKYKLPMPNQNLTDDEIRQYLQYFKCPKIEGDR
jgi:mono/diheme cytochrome c family protein